MCGRYTLTDPDPRLLRFRFGLTEAATIEQEPRYNVAPTDPVLAIRLNDDGEREPGVLRWGLIPHYADPDVFDRLLINARAETVGEAPAFCDAFETHRCLIVAGGGDRQEAGVDHPAVPGAVRLRGSLGRGAVGRWVLAPFLRDRHV